MNDGEMEGDARNIAFGVDGEGGAYRVVQWSVRAGGVQ